MLKKLKEANDLKEEQISRLNQKTRQAEELKAKILQKEKQLFEITKKQIRLDEQKPVQRSLASKWEMFNKNLSNYRNTMTTTGKPSYY